MTPQDTGLGYRIRSHAFRLWTACAILAAYVWSWLYRPELLTWWKHTTDWLIQSFCALLPYPWNDRIESSIGNIGLWVQITLAIIVLRIVVWALIAVLRGGWRARRRRRVLQETALEEL